MGGSGGIPLVWSCMQRLPMCGHPTISTRTLLKSQGLVLVIRRLVQQFRYVGIPWGPATRLYIKSVASKVPGSLATQSFQRSLIKEDALNHIGIPTMLWGIFLRWRLLEALGRPVAVVRRVSYTHALYKRILRCTSPQIRRMRVPWN